MPFCREVARVQALRAFWSKHLIVNRRAPHALRQRTNEILKEEGRRLLNARRRTSVSRQDADLICFSHLRWDFVYQRPQHLLSRFAKQRRVFFVEEPVHEAVSAPTLREMERQGVLLAVPVLPHGMSADESETALQQLLLSLLAEHDIVEYILWFYTPMALGYARELNPLAMVYDCMDELSMFKGAPPQLHEREAELLRLADIVFTGGHMLGELKQRQHPNVHAMPSSIDLAHFACARQYIATGTPADPPDHAGIPHPRLGFFGVVDERFDKELLAQIAQRRTDWHFVIIGPVAKIDPAELPQAANIHYLGCKSYAELPTYIAGWDMALLLFAINDSTRYISPTKTPEYLAAGRQVVSTPIADVVRPYGERGLVRIAATPDGFVTAIEQSLVPPDRSWLSTVDEFLAGNSWDATWRRMNDLLEAAIHKEYEHEDELLTSSAAD